MIVQDLNFDIEMVACPIIRELNGLALSSRNSYLSLEERSAALVISKSLEQAKRLLANGERNADIIKKTITELIEDEPLARIDYVDVVDMNLLESVCEINAPVLIAEAVYIGKTRLIDNFTFEEV